MKYPNGYLHGDLTQEQLEFVGWIIDNDINEEIMNEQEARTFLKDVNMDAPFWHEIHDEECKTINVNGRDMLIPIYNLIICTGQMRMYQHGVKPTRNWKVSTLKNYFGLKGNKAHVLQKLEAIKSEFTGR